MRTQRFLLHTADRITGALGMLDKPFDVERLLALASRAQDLPGFDTPMIAEPLQILLRSYEREANLSLVGRFAARWDVIRFLSNLTRLDHEERRRPEITAAQIEGPIFVTGLPRSGTTFLHRLLAEDPAHRVPRVWEAIYPYPDPASSAGYDPRPERVARQLRAFVRLAPEFPSLHPITSDAPQECTEITAHVFRSLRFDTTHDVPSYRRWLDQEGHRDAYRFHKRFLQHLQAQEHQVERWAPPRRWVLKAPEHVLALDSVRAVYPDAHLVFVHRDPLKVLPSVARLTEVIRAPFTRRLDRVAIGRQVTEHWLQGAACMIAASRPPYAAGQIVHVHYRALVAQPLEMVAHVYRQLGFEFSAAARERVTRLAAREPRGGYGQNRYSFDDYALDPAIEAERFRPYVEHFGVEPESGLLPHTAAPARAARVGGDALTA
jgi:hypothetical protein